MPRTPAILAILLVAIALLAAPGPAATVYLRDGNMHEGTIVEEDDKEVRIKLEGDGEVLTFARADILFIRREAELPALDPAPGSDPDTGGDESSEPRRSGDPLADLPADAFDPACAVRPESHVFRLMRQLEAARPGPASERLEESIQQWRTRAHDRMRNCNGEWLRPEEVETLRTAFAETLAEAQDLAKRFEGYAGWDERKIAKDRARWDEAMTKLREAAEKWPDPTIGEFLTGMADRRAEKWDSAAGLFQGCRDRVPCVAGFRQGLALALLELEQYDEALRELAGVLRLWPGSVRAINLVEAGMKKTPGTRMEEEAYLEAKGLVERYLDPKSTRRYSSRGETWLMPGERPWYTDKHELIPTPPYDRVVVRQGIGVPVAENLLMVDAAVVGRRQRALVRLGPGRIAAGRVRRQSIRSRDEATPKLAVIEVDGYEFQPVELLTTDKLPAGKGVVLYGLNHYLEMGGAAREERAAIEGVSADGALELDRSLLPGESAGPALTSEGKLAGFMAGRTDAAAEAGGPAVGIPISHVAELIAGAEEGSSSYVRYGRVRRKADAPTPLIAGEAFVVYAVHPERLEE